MPDFHQDVGNQKPGQEAAALVLIQQSQADNMPVESWLSKGYPTVAPLTSINPRGLVPYRSHGYTQSLRSNFAALARILDSAHRFIPLSPRIVEPFRRVANCS